MTDQRPTDMQVNRSLHENPEAPRIVDSAVAAFGDRYDHPRLPSLVVVIAALNEEASVGDVIDSVPATIEGLATRVLVIDDGSTDATSEVSDAHGALVARFGENLGHGTAMRAGYRIAREGGAHYIATLDADGQWDAGDLPAMVRLLESGDADFVVGSRQLGRTECTDGLRNAGVVVFSRLISVLTGTPVTDSSSGLRAMRTEVTEKVRQTQPQYQTSELLIGAIFQGYRVREVPTVMHERAVGESRKGRNGAYAFRYASVIANTTWREWWGRSPDHRRRAGLNVLVHAGPSLRKTLRAS